MALACKPARSGVRGARGERNHTLIALVIIGSIGVAAGIFGLGYCIREGFRVRKASLPPQEIHARLQKLVAVNLGSVAMAALGLAILVAGLML